VTQWQINASGSISVVQDTPIDLAGVREQAKMLLLTDLGELENEPTFGTRLSELVHADHNSQTLQDLVRIIVSESLAQWMPYVFLRSVLVQEKEQGEKKVVLGLGILGTSQTFQVEV
jgi:phage baseplate assembly protein W